ncbi:MAG: beta-lactamase family protein [Tannerella sp.]|jgi:CubicO group peptidase (beta-lactamase class C family)|nr:beta-lactamase family protein [Tannerella sp.]
MKKVIFICLLFLSGITTIAFAQQSKPQAFTYTVTDINQLGIDSDRLIYIDRLLQEYVDKGIIPQALTFVARNGVVVHNKTFGWSDIESKKPLNKNDIFRNYSQTKAITSVALMTLFEQGKFQLDDPVSKYIPECTDVVLEQLNEDGTYTTRPAASPVTIRHLLSHTSGIAGNRDVQKIRQEQMNKRNNKPYETLAEEVKDLVQLPLSFAPGTQWNYHPASDVCGYLVEYFSGKSLRDYVKETILIPLEMKDSDWYYPESYRQRMVTAYNEKEGKLVAQSDVWSGRNPFSTDTRYCQAGTGLNGTIEDYARFCQMIVNGGIFNNQRILGGRTIEMMSTDQLPHPNNGGTDFCFGLGFKIYPDKDNELKGIPNFASMVSPGSLQWGGYYKTDYLIDPKENLIILLYTNRIPDTKVWEKFLNTVYQALE